jgi:hypothetical protein
VLTGYQCETIAFYPRDAGEFICPDCAVEQYGALAVSAAEDGLANSGELSPVSRYSLDEYAGERTWEYAEDRVREFENDHPQIFGALLAERWRVVDRYAEKHEMHEYCGNCGGEIS